LPARKSQLVDLQSRMRALADQHHALFAKLALGLAESRRLCKAVDEMVLANATSMPFTARYWACNSGCPQDAEASCTGLFEDFCIRAQRAAAAGSKRDIDLLPRCQPFETPRGPVRPESCRLARRNRTKRTSPADSPRHPASSIVQRAAI
jgi:hypothetical protein